MSLQNSLAVISQSGCSLSFFNISTGERLFHLPNLPNQPHELAYDAGRRLLYISHTYKSGYYYKHGDYCQDISVFDIGLHKIIDTISIAPYGGPHGLRLSSNGEVLFSSFEHGLEDGGGVLSIDLTTRKLIKAVGSGSHPHWFVLTKDENKAYTTNKDKDFISALDLKTGNLKTKITFPQSEEGDISVDGRFVYFPFPSLSPTMREGDVGFKVIDTSTDEVVRTIVTELPVISVFTTAQNKLMVGHYNNEYSHELSKMVFKPGRLELYDLETLQLEGEVEIGMMPLTMRASPDGFIGVVGNMMSGTVTVVDLQEMKVLRVLEVDVVPVGAPNQGAHGMAFIV
jgi:DNA-binding beta-propeller fold protein YncE